MLGPLLFLILKNDLANISQNLFSLLFADETTFQISSNNLKDLLKLANLELEKASDWFKENKLTLNVSKTKYILFQKKNDTNDIIGELIDEQHSSSISTLNCTDRPVSLFTSHHQ